MLQSLRSGARSPIMKFFLLFLAGGFALWGIGDGTTGLIGGSDKAISAGDASVSPREVAIEFERTRRSFLTNTTTEEALQGGLLNEVVGALSRDVLIRAEAKNLGLTVTRAMQSDAIRNDAGFKDDFGKFSEGRFTQALAGAGLSETEYLQRVSGALMRDQLIGALAAGSRFDSNSASIIAAYDLERRTVRLTSFAVDTDSVSAPDDATLDKYFAKNKATYDAPILRTVKVASISAEMIAKDIKISADDIKTAYDNRQDEFTTAETRDLRQMVFESKADAKTALDRLAKGESFAAVAKDMLSLTDADTKLGRISKDALDTALA
ncbi:MAG: SurA N-terminal domain-containing protein, partial [Alphaproteobacteria bacterium]